MSNDMTYKFRKEETNKNGSLYFKKGFGRRENPTMTPYEYGSVKNKSKKRGVKR